MVNALAINPRGSLLVSGGQDMSLRVWVKTNELVELSHEGEEERRLEEEKTEKAEAALGAQLKHVEGENKDSLVLRASRPTHRTAKAIYDLLDGIDMVGQSLKTPDGPPHFLLTVHQT